MAERLWDQVDRWLVDDVVRPDPVYEEILRRSQHARLPAIQVSPVQGKLLHVLALAVGARQVLEIGTLGGYSTAWLALAVGERGRVITIEGERRHAEVARENLDRAGVGDRVEIRVGRAADLLQKMAAEPREPFDLVFIDADKPGYADYLQLSIPLSRPGTLIVADNVVRGGLPADPRTEETNAAGIRRFFQAVASEPRVVGTAFQTVGSKGHDGLAVLVVTAPAG